ncbi:MAG: DUF2442 domain-containing protein [Oscillospiraceae bacterium]|nr:DUF2442 domain-containing protein [Oscillospiraceae bacterium]
MLPRVKAVTPGEDYQLFLTFTNGEKKVFDVRPLLDIPVYKSLMKNFYLAQAGYGTVIWPGDIDISPDTLYLKSSPV